MIATLPYPLFTLVLQTSLCTEQSGTLVTLLSVEYANQENPERCQWKCIWEFSERQGCHSKAGCCTSFYFTLDETLISNKDNLPELCNPSRTSSKLVGFVLSFCLRLVMSRRVTFLPVDLCELCEPGVSSCLGALQEVCPLPAAPHCSAGVFSAKIWMIPEKQGDM